MAEIDSLEIKLTANAQSANRSITGLIDKLNVLSGALGKVDGSSLLSLSTGVQSLSSAMSGLSSVGLADYTRLGKGLDKISNANFVGIDNVSAAITGLSNSLQQLGSINTTGSLTQLTDLIKGISKFGNKSAVQAVANIPLLAREMKNLMTTLSTAPKVSQNLIDMTNALGNLARTGASSGRAVNALSSSMNMFSSSASRSSKASFSLARTIGKIYASYFLLFRGFGKLKEAIDISSDITEVQNVVDTTFGKYTDKVENLVSTSIEQFGMSELTVKSVSSRFQAMGTALGFTQEKMSDMSVDLVKLTADMASFYNVEQKAVAEDLESIFTGTTKPLRQYGIDLTEANLKEWALTQGIKANFSAMTGQEKAQLRYAYVLAQTEKVQGDFAKTSGRLCAA